MTGTSPVTRQGHAWLFGLFVMFLTACAVQPNSREAHVSMTHARHTTPTALPFTYQDAVVIAHRGASGLLPEHTMAAYALAIEQGADFIEPDLVMTRDGLLVARHDPWLSDSTNVAELQQYTDRKRKVTSPDGQVIDDWWVWDFTYAELLQLKARQVRAGRPTESDDLFDIPLFADIIDLAKTETAKRGRTVGVYPEAKWPVEHARMDLDIETAFVEALEAADWSGRDAPVYVQCFEPSFLKSINTRIDTPLVQLAPFSGSTGYDVDLAAIAEYAEGFGPYKAMILDPASGRSTGLGLIARDMGLKVHPWTFRDDDLPAWTDDPATEMRAAIDAGATGVFTDFPATAVAAFSAD